MSFVLSIENPNDVFLPGQTIVGKVCCSLTEPQVLDIKVRLIGEEYTCLPDQPYQVLRWDGTIEFLKTESIDIESGECILGEHNFPFKFTLPNDIPSSYKGRYGHVKYFVEVSMTERIKTKTDKMEVKVFAPLNLKNEPHLSLVPSVHSDEVATQKWFCLCCVPEAIGMDVKLEKNAFVVGELVNVELTLRNRSYLTVLSITTQLCLKTYAKVSLPVDQLVTDCQVLSTHTKRGIGSYQNKTYMVQLKIPDHAEITNFQSCKRFAQRAFLEVKAVFKHFAERNLEVVVELVLGHYSSDRQNGSLENIRGSAVGLPYRTVHNPSGNTSQSSALFLDKTVDFPCPTADTKRLAPPPRSSTASYPRRNHPCQSRQRFVEDTPIYTLSETSTANSNCFGYTDSDYSYQCDFTSEPGACSETASCDNVCDSGGGDYGGGDCGGGDCGGGDGGGGDCGGGDGGGGDGGD